MAAGVALVIAGYAGFLHLPMSEPPLKETAQSAPEFTFGGSFIGPAGLKTPSLEGEATMTWLAEHLGEATLHLPDLEPLGLRLVGGGVLTSSMAPAVRLIYADEEDQHLLLYMGVSDSEADQAFTLMPEGLLSLHWRRGPLVLALVGSLDSPRLLDVMRLVNDGIGQVAPENLSPAQEAAATAPIREVGIASPAAATASTPVAGAAKEAVVENTPAAVTPLPPATPPVVAEQPKPL